jgi:DNA-binding transcriptional MerR regulator
MEKPSTDYLTAADVARLDGTATPATVRSWERAGRLPCIRTAGGVRLFRREDAVRLIETRRQARELEARGSVR